MSIHPDFGNKTRRRGFVIDASRRGSRTNLEFL